MAIYGPPAGCIWRAWHGHPWASNSPRVNNQPECFSNMHTQSRLQPPGPQGGVKSQGPSTRLTSKLWPRKNKLGGWRGQNARGGGGGRSSRERATSRPHTGELLFNSMQMEEAVFTDFHLPTLPSPPPLLLQRKQKGCLLRFFLYHFTWLFKAITFLLPFQNLDSKYRVSRV